jgi:hypothetical protein
MQRYQPSFPLKIIVMLLLILNQQLLPIDLSDNRRLHVTHYVKDQHSTGTSYQSNLARNDSRFTKGDMLAPSSK